MYNYDDCLCLQMRSYLIVNLQLHVLNIYKIRKLSFSSTGIFNNRLNLIGRETFNRS